MALSTDQPVISEDLTLNVDEIVQAFDGKHFYGLEYVLADIFQTALQQQATAVATLDQYGFYF